MVWCGVSFCVVSSLFSLNFLLSTPTSTASFLVSSFLSLVWGFLVKKPNFFQKTQKLKN